VGLFGNRKSPSVVDPELPDDQWLRASREAYERAIEQYYGSPEAMANGGEENYSADQFGIAMFFYAKSIDMLHTAYGFAQMAQRQPSPVDLGIVDGFVNSLGAALASHPEAPVDECVREVTHRLRSISTECDRVGLPSALYRRALNRLAETAPNVKTDDILWT